MYLIKTLLLILLINISYNQSTTGVKDLNKSDKKTDPKTAEELKQEAEAKAAADAKAKADEAAKVAKEDQEKKDQAAKVDTTLADLKKKEEEEYQKQVEDAKKVADEQVKAIVTAKKVDFDACKAQVEGVKTIITEGFAAKKSKRSHSTNTLQSEFEVADALVEATEFIHRKYAEAGEPKEKEPAPKEESEEAKKKEAEDAKKKEDEEAKKKELEEKQKVEDAKSVEEKLMDAFVKETTELVAKVGKQLEEGITKGKEVFEKVKKSLEKKAKRAIRNQAAEKDRFKNRDRQTNASAEAGETNAKKDDASTEETTKEETMKPEDIKKNMDTLNEKAQVIRSYATPAAEEQMKALDKIQKDLNSILALGATATAVTDLIDTALAHERMQVKRGAIEYAINKTADEVQKIESSMSYCKDLVRDIQYLVNQV